MSQPILLRLPPRPPGGKTNPQKQNPPKISTGLSAVWRPRERPLGFVFLRRASLRRAACTALLAGAVVVAELDRTCVAASGRTGGFDARAAVVALGSGFMTQGIVARRSFAAAHREIVVRVIKSTVEGTRYAIANEDYTKRLIAKYLGINDNDLLRQSFLYVTETFVREPFVPESTMQSMVQRMVHVNMIDAKSVQATPTSAYFDNSYVTELKQSGFLDGIWK